MRFIGIDNKEYNVSIAKYTFNNRPGASSAHVAARELLKEFYPFDRPIEEFPLPGSGKQPLYADFFLPNQMLMVEVHGRQHFEFVPFFHVDKAGFYKHQARDRAKIEWCKINDIDLIVLNAGDSEDEWRKIISNYRGAA